MVINQRGVAVTGNNEFPVDRWRVVKNDHGAYSGTQDNDHPPGFGKSMQIACTTAKASLSASSQFVLMQRIEGFNVQQFDKGAAGARPFSVSFWFKTNKAGNYTVRLEDVVNDRSVSWSFEVTAANATNNAWVQYTHTFPADTTGALPTSNASALEFQIWLCAGTNFTSGTLNTTWAADDADKSAAGQVNFFDSTNNRAFLSGVQLTATDGAIEFQHEDYGTTLTKCERYYYKAPDGIWRLYQSGSSRVQANMWFPTTMRATPDCALFNVSASGSVTSVTASDANPRGFLAVCNPNNATLPGTTEAYAGTYSGDAEL